MAAGYPVRIITPEDVYLEAEAVSIIAPGFEGYFGVLRGHAPLVTPLVRGHLYVRLVGGAERRFDVEGGFLEVSPNGVLILVERIGEGAAQPAGA
jgi:F-type H+-transporting ATPase subunit epsilon